MDRQTQHTPDPSPRRGAYSSHRERQRRRILDAAEALFIQHGIDRVTIADIVNRAGVRASTIYAYFANKDEVVGALVAECFAESVEPASRAMASGRNALEKITALLEFMAVTLSRDAAKVRFMAQFDAMYARDWPAERLLSLEAQIYPEGLRRLTDLVREGIADGSLRPDLDPDLTLHAVMNAIAGTQRRLASLGSKVELEYGQPIDRLFRETVRIILLGLRSSDPPPATARPGRTASTKTRKRTP